jgi:GntP family gluconate:H+ symporter
LNDGGFWIVKECLNLTVPQTFRTWSMCETIIGVVGLGLALAVSAFI